MEIVADNASDAYVATLKALATAAIVAPRGLKVREIDQRVSLRIARPQATFVETTGRKLVHAITAIEGTSLVGQTSVPELLVERVGAFAPYANDGIFWGAYGPRAAGDVGLVVDLLKRDPDSRQAVISLYDSDRDLGRENVKDVPCTVAIQFFLRPEWVKYGEAADKLHMWVVMRSNDAWLGLPYDLGQFSLLQFAIAQALGAEVGSYTHSVGSMHLYERDWEAAADIGQPKVTYYGHDFGASNIDEIASRCRQILLGRWYGQGVQTTSLEKWLSGLITARDRA